MFRWDTLNYVLRSWCQSVQHMNVIEQHNIEYIKGKMVYFNNRGYRHTLTETISNENSIDIFSKNSQSNIFWPYYSVQQTITVMWGFTVSIGFSWWVLKKSDVALLPIHIQQMRFVTAIKGTMKTIVSYSFKYYYPGHIFNYRNVWHYKVMTQQIEVVNLVDVSSPFFSALASYKLISTPKFVQNLGLFFCSSVSNVRHHNVAIV